MSTRKNVHFYVDKSLIRIPPHPALLPPRDCVIIEGVVIPNECEESYIIDVIIVEDFSDSLEMTKWNYDPVSKGEREFTSYPRRMIEGHALSWFWKLCVSQSLQQFIVFSMRSYPKPNYFIFLNNANGPIIFGDSDRIYGTGRMNLLEVQARVIGVLKKLFISFPG
jgi:hypothetical protein